MTEARETEAACLLKTGALYKTRIGLQPSGEGNDLIFAGFKQGAFSVYFGDQPIYHFDLEGRWQRAFIEPTHYLKSLDTTVQAIDRVREGPNMVLKRRTLGFAEAADLDARIRSMAIDLLGALGATIDRQDPPGDKASPLADDDLRRFLERIASWDLAAWFAHRERYLSTYGPLPFLPPESQTAMILQATLGHSNGVSFGNFPRSEHYVRSPSEFEQHAREVATLMGRRLLQSRVIFLAGSDVLRRPTADVLGYLQTLASVFSAGSGSPENHGSGKPLEDTPRIDGIHVFLDDFTEPQPDRVALAAFRDRRLARVALGVESGDSHVRSLYRKTWTDVAFRGMVENLKAAGLGVSILTLAGAGGTENAEPHIAQTKGLLNSLPLDRGDTVFLLDANEIRGASTGRQEFTPLTSRGCADQQESLKLALGPLRERGVKVLPYSLDKQST